ncbi:hypothetical protein DITRI_Ditri11bG0123000 [Diplodiscus trichospermus]
MEIASLPTKKRKVSHDDDEDDEEEKMEKFYALIKSIREARERLIINNSTELVNKEYAEQSETKKRKLEEEKKVAVWKPSFQREDFMEETDKLKKPPASLAGTSQTKERTHNDQKEEVKEELDLTLSL